MVARPWLLAVAVAVVALAPPAQARGDTTIASLPAPTPVRAWDGIAVLSLADSPTSTYRLAVLNGEGAPRPVPGIAPSARPFDADIGPGPGGAPVIVYARCRTGCPLFRTTAAGGETPIAGTMGAKAPSVWGSRLAFARTGRVYVRPLDAPGTVRSTRLRSRPGSVFEIELRRTALARVVVLDSGDYGICGEWQVRLGDVRRPGPDALVADTFCGLGGQHWLGLSWAGRRLLFANSCPGDPAGCREAGAIAYRYSTRTRRLETVLRPDYLLGFAALDARRALEVRATEDHFLTCDNSGFGRPPPCLLVRDDPLAWRAEPERH